jgi:hypothetical protein
MILLNSVTLNHQPTIVQELATPIQTDVEAIDGSQQRNFIQYKYTSTMTFSMLAPADYQQIFSIINTSSGLVTYYNNLSDYASNNILQFTGLATYKESPYSPGSSAVRDLELTIKSV